MKWIKKLLGIEDLLQEQKKTNELLEKLARTTNWHAELQKVYNAAHNIY